VHCDGSGSKFFDRGQFFVAQVGLGQVSHLWFGVWIRKISPKNPKFFIFFLLGRVKKYLGQRQVGLLFTAGEKFMVVSGQGFFYLKGT